MKFRTVDTRRFMYQVEFKVEFEDGSSKWINESELRNLEAKRDAQ